ncbi:MAG: hypothetical protein ACSHX8_13965 [Opitutaceae bacterium]
MKKRTAVTIAMGATMLYALSYATVSAFGHYEPTQSGEARYEFGLSITDVEIWNPKGIEFKRMKDIEGSYQTSANLLGHLYTPLILVDRMFIHKTQDLLTLTTEAQIQSE